MFTWVDALHAVHNYMNSQTGGVMSMGLCVTHYGSSKKTLNKKSSTNLELVGASDYVPYNIRYVMFMHQQGYMNNFNNFIS